MPYPECDRYECPECPRVDCPERDAPRVEELDIESQLRYLEQQVATHTAQMDALWSHVHRQYRVIDAFVAAITRLAEEENL
jgi:hypothetical protein